MGPNKPFGPTPLPCPGPGLGWAAGGLFPTPPLPEPGGKPPAPRPGAPPPRAGPRPRGPDAPPSARRPTTERPVPRPEQPTPRPHAGLAARCRHGIGPSSQGRSRLVRDAAATWGPGPAPVRGGAGWGTNAPAASPLSQGGKPPPGDRPRAPGHSSHPGSRS
ncbi:translation initiation factor IF-2 [Streptomyces malaysiensis]|uniref:Translation initiation factor IF-2 n=1 Tax=Streptomyces malaysiensis TaxID=92644 RepID=A0A7X6B034_STRMQ|nr:translation initiation factor IF-2 [Streptomyces malaysiensis]